MNPNPNITEAVISKFCLLYSLENYSVRVLEQRFGIPRSTIHYHLTKRLGKRGQRKPQGLMPVIKEHLTVLKGRQQLEVRRWLNQHKQEILASDLAHAGQRLLTNHQERSQSYEECWASQDFRSVIDGLYWRGGDAA